MINIGRGGGGGSSVHTSTTEMASMKKSYINIILDTKYPMLVKKIFLFGFLGGLILASVTSALFFTVNSNFE